MARRVRNIYIEKENHVEILIFDKKDNYKHTVFISKNRLNDVKKYSWSTYKSRKRHYAHAHIGEGKYIKMHRLIAEKLYGKSKKTVDHINKNGLDNRDVNLRYACNSTQGHNKGMFGHNTSGVKGVNFNKLNNRWRAEIDYKKKRYSKSFKTFEEAVKQRKEWESKIQKGEFL
ncbi:HNH endonuclease [Siminovitchia sp. 179-K 8D1 HS]|uniref:HNH endonuclease n=1 Tax=Siminovitchia sp. 179-K 8D1 HS TaxID=3142385 RepID=UPI0039A10631